MWHRTDGWRLDAGDHRAVAVIDCGEVVGVVAHDRPGGFLLGLPVLLEMIPRRDNLPQAPSAHD